MPGRSHELFRLNVENITSYLATVAKQLPFHLSSLRGVEEVGEYSNNNYLFRLSVGTGPRLRLFYLKQAQRFNRRSVQQGKPFVVPQGRMSGEVKLLKRLEKLWDKGVVPHVYFFDRRHWIFLMSDVGSGGKILIEEFSHNLVHPELGAILGRYLSKLHVTTYKSREASGASRDWCEVMVDFFDTHWGHGVRQYFPHHEVGSFYEEVCSVPTSIVWGDAVHRNMFIKPHGRVGLIDFDHTVRYDPMVDVGMLLAHWIWMWLKGNRKVNRDCKRFIRNFNKAYWKEWGGHPKFSPIERTAMLHRLPRWVGLYLVSRTDGKSGSYFEEWPVWERRIRRLGIELFGERKTELTKSYLKLLKV